MTTLTIKGTGFAPTTGLTITGTVDDSFSFVSISVLKKFRLMAVVYSDASESNILLKGSERTVNALSQIYDWTTPTDEAFVSLRRKGLKALFWQDNWDILDKDNKVIGGVKQVKPGPLSPLYSFMAQRTYNVTINGTQVATILRKASEHTLNRLFTFELSAEDDYYQQNKSMLFCIGTSLTIEELRKSSI